VHNATFSSISAISLRYFALLGNVNIIYSEHGFLTSYVVVYFVFSEFSEDERSLFVLLILVELMTIPFINNSGRLDF
jgi:hypothetical protein